MKTKVISRLLTLLIATVLVFLIIKLHSPNDQSDFVDVLVDAGLEFSVSPVDAELLSYRKIVITTDINAASAQRTIKALLLLDAVDSMAPIDLYIRTEGGWVSDAFGIIDVMESITAPVNTHAIGATHSSGAMILTAGTGVRCAYPFSSIMFHAGLSDDDGEYSEGKLDNDRLTQFWKRHSRISTGWITAEENKTFFLSPDEALKYGLIDRIKADANKPTEGDIQ